MTHTPHTPKATRHALHVVLDDTGFSIEEEYSTFLKTQSTTTRRIIDGPFHRLDTAETRLDYLQILTKAEYRDFLFSRGFPDLTGTIAVPTTNSAPPIALASVTLFDE